MRMRRGRSRLPRGYYLVEDASKGGLQLSEYTEPILNMPVTMGQVPELVAAEPAMPKGLLYGLIAAVGLAVGYMVLKKR